MTLRRRFIKRKDNGISFIPGDNTLTCRQSSGAQPDIYTTGTYYKPTCEDWSTKTDLSTVYFVPLSDSDSTLDYTNDNINTYDTFAIVIEDTSTGLRFIVGTNADNSLQYSIVTDDTPITDSEFQWTMGVVSAASGIHLWFSHQITGRTIQYACVNSDGELFVTNDKPTTYFTFTTDDDTTNQNNETMYYRYLSYAYKTTFSLPEPTSNQLGIQFSTSSVYNIKVYSISNSNKTYTLLPSSSFLDSSTKCLIMTNGTNYYLIRNNLGAVKLVDLGTVEKSTSNGSTTITCDSAPSDSYIDQAKITVIEKDTSKNQYHFKFIGLSIQYYLSKSSTTYSAVLASTYDKVGSKKTKPVVLYSDTTGLYPGEPVATTGPFGPTVFRLGYVTTQDAKYAGGALLLDAATGTVQSSIGTGTYALVIVNEEGYYDLISHDGDGLVFTRYDDLSDITIGADAQITVVQQTNGYGLFFGSYGLNSSNNELKLLAVSLDWAYSYNASDADNSRLYSVATSTADYYTEYANSDLEANTQATDTTCDIFLVQNGKVQIQADEFVDGETYVLVFVDNGNHYAACVNGTDIVPVLYANSLPKNLPSDYHFVAEASGQGFILKHNNQAMGVAVNTKLTLGYNAVWTYTGGTNE